MSGSTIGDLLTDAFEPALLEVPRQPEEPAPQQVYLAMDEGVPYTASELATEWDVTRYTVKDRLEQLHEDGFIERKKHGKRTVTYWVPTG